MMIDIGSLEALMMALTVSGMSEMTPSVSISRIKYCCTTEQDSTIYIHALQLSKHVGLVYSATKPQKLRVINTVQNDTENIRILSTRC